MCYELDVVQALIHIHTRRRYPGIKFHEETLNRVAIEFSIRNTTDIRAMSEMQLAELTSAVLRYLPASACPDEWRAAVS